MIKLPNNHLKERTRILCYKIFFTNKGKNWIKKSMNLNI